MGVEIGDKVHFSSPDRQVVGRVAVITSMDGDRLLSIDVGDPLFFHCVRESQIWYSVPNIIVELASRVAVRGELTTIQVHHDATEHWIELPWPAYEGSTMKHSLVFCQMYDLGGYWTCLLKNPRVYASTWAFIEGDEERPAHRTPESAFQDLLEELRKEETSLAHTRKMLSGDQYSTDEKFHIKALSLYLDSIEEEMERRREVGISFSFIAALSRIENLNLLLGRVQGAGNDPILKLEFSLARRMAKMRMKLVSVLENGNTP